MATEKETYPASFDIDYPEKLNRLSTFFRILWSIPIVIILVLLSAGGSEIVINESSKEVSTNGRDVTFGLFAVTALMIVFRHKYPRWWFNFALELNRFMARVGAYLFLLTDRYPSTTDEQSVHLNIDYPNVEQDLNRWLPLIKWLLVLPHIFVLLVLMIPAIGGTIVAWFAILFTGRYPKNIFNYMVGLGRWGNRINAYAFLLTTDKYPPFSLK